MNTYNLTTPKGASIEIETNATAHDIVAFIRPGIDIEIPAVKITVPDDTANGHKAPKKERKVVAPISDNDKARVLGQVRAGSIAGRLINANVISNNTGIDPATVSRILATLKRAGEVKVTGKGKGSMWSAVEKAAEQKGATP